MKRTEYDVIIPEEHTIEVNFTTEEEAMERVSELKRMNPQSMAFVNRLDR